MQGTEGGDEVASIHTIEAYLGSANLHLQLLRKNI